MELEREKAGVRAGTFRWIVGDRNENWVLSKEAGSVSRFASRNERPIETRRVRRSSRTSPSSVYAHARTDAYVFQASSLEDTHPRSPTGSESATYLA